MGVAGLAALVALAACASAPAEPEDLPGPLVGATIVDDASARRCLGGPSALARRDEVEPHVAMNPADPDHLVAAWMVRVPGSPGAILAAASRTGGRTWEPARVLPFNVCAGGPAGLRASSDPWVAFGPEGRVYVTAIGWTPGEAFDSASVLGVLTSADGGTAWGDLVEVSSSRTPAFMHDNSAIAADPRSTGSAWVTTTYWGPEGRPAAIARTGDGGATWSPLAFVIEPEWGPGPASAPQPLVTEDGLFVFYGADEEGSRIAFVRSPASGEADWTSPRTVHEGLPIEGPVRFPGGAAELAVAEDIMHPAADPATGDLYVVFTSAAGPDDSGRPVVRLTASRDGGASWSAPVPVGEPGESAWRPTLAVAAGGPAVVTFFRAAPEDAPGRAKHPTELRMRAFDWPEGPAPVGRPAVTLDRFDWRPRADGTRFLGDYHGLVAVDGAAVAVYARSTDAGARILAVREDLP